MKNSIRRIIAAHAATMSGVGNWIFEAEQTDGGANSSTEEGPRKASWTGLYWGPDAGNAPPIPSSNDRTRRQSALLANIG